MDPNELVADRHLTRVDPSDGEWSERHRLESSFLSSPGVRLFSRARSSLLALPVTTTIPSPFPQEKSHKEKVPESPRMSN
jgi:hypothetical protein